MKYAITEFRNCSYKIRRNNALKVQLGLPRKICPNCEKFIIDTMQLEYECIKDIKKANFISKAI